MATCLRFERYSYGIVDNGIVSAPPYFVLVGLVPTLRRLAAIATGIDSVILGDNFIKAQVASAFNARDLDIRYPLLGTSATAIATELRERFCFYAPDDYDDIAFRLLGTSEGRQKHGSNLVIIGSGMLARALCTHREARGYDNIYAVTRSPVKGGVKADHRGGVKVDQRRCRRSGIVGEEGVWSGGLRRLKGGAFRPERKTSSSPRRVRRRGLAGGSRGGRWAD